MPGAAANVDTFIYAAKSSELDSLETWTLQRFRDYYSQSLCQVSLSLQDDNSFQSLPASGDCQQALACLGLKAQTPSLQQGPSIRLRGALADFPHLARTNLNLVWICLNLVSSSKAFQERSFSQVLETKM